MSVDTLAGAVVVFAVVLVAFSAVKRGAHLVPETHVAIIERLGRFHRVLEPGLHFLIPGVDVQRTTVDMSGQLGLYDPQPIITADQLVIHISLTVYYQIPDDPEHAKAVSIAYETSNLGKTVETFAYFVLRDIIGKVKVEQLLANREKINTELLATMNEALSRWGPNVTRAAIRTVEMDDTLSDLMVSSIKSRRRRSGIIKEAAFEKQAAILRAEGERLATVLKAQGEGEAFAEIFEQIRSGNPEEVFLAYQYLQTLPQIAASDSDKVLVVVPSELGKALQGFGGQGLGGQAFGGPAFGGPEITESAVGPALPATPDNER
jgi:regulator of protease activity HflC (stomatin/prohibitin superfamily)